VLVGLGFAASLYLGETYAPDQMKIVATDIQRNTETAIALNANGHFTEIAARRWLDWLSMLQFVLPLQGPGLFGFFLFGLAAVRADLLSDASAPLWVKSRRIYLPVGVLLSLVGAGVYMMSKAPISSTALLAYSILVLAAPFSSLGYIGLIAKWSQGPMSKIKVFLARGGTASLTAYLLQSLILSLIFAGYGLGYFGKLGAVACVALAFCVGMFTIAFASLWRTRFKRGPMEMLLRRWTYFAHQR